MKLLFIFLCLFLSIWVYARSNSEYQELANNIILLDQWTNELSIEETKNSLLIAEIQMQKAWYCEQLTNSQSMRKCKIAVRNWNTLFKNK